jgi:hypothetical protein
MKRRPDLQTLAAYGLAALSAIFLIWIGIPLLLLLLQVMSGAMSR